MGIPNELPHPFGPLFDLERGRLLDLLGPLHASDWELPTPCPGWDVLGLATHLLGGDLGLLSRTRDQHNGTDPPEGLDEDGFIVWLDQLQADWVDAARRLSPRVVVELLAWSGPQVSSMIARQDPNERTAHVSWASDQAVPVWLDQCRELSEWWIHRQQIRQALNLGSDLNVDLAGPVLEGLRWAYPRRLSFIDLHVGASALVEIVGEGIEASWRFVFEGSGWGLSNSASRTADAHLKMSAEQAWRLLTNNLPLEEQKQLSTSGQPEIVRVLTQTRAIIGAPK